MENGLEKQCGRDTENINRKERPLKRKILSEESDIGCISVQIKIESDREKDRIRQSACRKQLDQDVTNNDPLAIEALTKQEEAQKVQNDRNKEKKNNEK
jgi:hypothetical protein